MRSRILTIAGAIATGMLRAVGAQVPTASASATTDSTVTDSAFAAIWSRVCQGAAPRDSGLIYGVVRDARDRRTVADANVDVTWNQITPDAKKVYRQKRLRLSTQTNPAGVYGICGVPLDQFIRVGAGSEGRVSGLINISPTERRLARRDLMIGIERDSSERGVVFGSVVDILGAAVDNARVVIDDTTEVRTRADGRFFVRNVLPGTRQVEVFSIGMVPVVTTVDVTPRDSTPLGLRLRRVTALDAVKVIASHRAQAIIDGLEERKRKGVGYLIEAGDIYGHSDLVSVLQEFPSTQVSRAGGEFTVTSDNGRGRTCQPDVWVDGAKSAQAILPAMRMSELVAVEMFARPESVPLQFRSIGQDACGVIALWTTWAFGR